MHVSGSYSWKNQGSGGHAAEGLASYRHYQRETALPNARPRLVMREVFMAGPHDQPVEAPTFLRGDPLRITEGGRYL
jgi:hypothetical protein